MFDSIPPNISKDEFYNKLLPYLSFAGWSTEDITKVKLVFEPLLDEDGSAKYKGIDAKEMESGLESLTENHGLSQQKIKVLREHLTTYLGH